MNSLDPSGNSTLSPFGKRDHDTLLSKLFKICKTCLSNIKDQENCRRKAERIAFEISGLWGRNFGLGPKPNTPMTPHTVGGWYCYEWATSFHKIGEKCGAGIITSKTRVVRKTGFPDHVYTRFCAGPRTNVNCCVDVDDAFFVQGRAYCHTPGVMDSEPGYDFVPGEEAIPGHPMDLGDLF
jgi:hypothetical protein